MNSVASQSSNSGWTGGSPCEPKSSAVLTMPWPKYICQKRLTVTREVNGGFGSTSHLASVRRLAFSSFGQGGRTPGVPAVTLLVLLGGSRRRGADRCAGLG